MKKFLTIAAVALVAMSVQAAQINWGLTGQIKFNNTLVGANATLTLVCLDGVSDWATYANDVALGATLAIGGRDGNPRCFGRSHPTIVRGDLYSALATNRINPNLVGVRLKFYGHHIVAGGKCYTCQRNR